MVEVLPGRRHRVYPAGGIRRAVHHLLRAEDHLQEIVQKAVVQEEGEEKLKLSPNPPTILYYQIKRDFVITLSVRD